MRRLADHAASLIDGIEAFFEPYSRLNDRAFRPLGRGGPETARRLVEAASERDG